MNIQWTLATRYLWGRKLRTLLTTLAVMFGVLVIFGMNTMLPALMNAFQANVKAAAGEVDATITLKTSEPFNVAEANRVSSIEGVTSINAYLSRLVNLPVDYYDNDPDQSDKATLLSLVGVDVLQATVMHAFTVSEGRFLEPGDKHAAVITQSLAEAIDVSLGDAFALPVAIGEERLTVIGILPPLVSAGNEEVMVTLPEAQRMLDLPGQVNAIEANFGSVNGSERAAIETQILEELGDSYQLGSLSGNSQFLTTLNASQVIFSLLGVLALLMGGFIIFNTFRTIVAERRRDIGMLRTLGANRGTIIGIILAEGLLQGIIGTGLGLLFGYLLANFSISLMSGFMRQFINVQVGGPVVSAGLLVGSIAIGLGVTLIAGFLPAIAASRVTPMEALRPTVGQITIRRMAGLGFWAGVLMIATALALLLSKDMSLLSFGGLLFIIGLFFVTPTLVTPVANILSALLARVYARGGTAKLAEGNLSRQPSRAATTASTTLIALAIVVMAAALVSSLQIGFSQILRKSLGADFLLLPPSVATWGLNVGATQALRDEVTAMDGVRVVSTFRFAPVLMDDNVVELMGIDPITFPQVSGLEFTAGDENAAYTELQAGRTIIPNGIMASLVGAEVGEEIVLQTPNGAQSYRVIGVATDYLSAKIPTATLSQENLEADFGVNQDMLFLVDAESGANRESVESNLKVLLAAYPQFRLVDGQAYIEESLALFEAAFAGLTAMVLFLAIPSLIAMVNTLTIGVIERTREIGMLRAIGATRGQVRAVILAEALILSGIGTVFGILTGTYLGYLAVQAIGAAGFPTQYAFPASGILLGIAAGIAFGILAAIIPARQAARLQVVQALRYE
ncbi:MAG: FtsX-like permease family protein [Anaerolineales bacterium]